MRHFPRLSLRHLAILGSRQSLASYFNYRTFTQFETGTSTPHQAWFFRNFPFKNKIIALLWRICVIVFWLTAAGLWVFAMMYFFQNLLVENYR